jgi:membrane protease YdiL (CAAX protease family)
VPLVHTVAGVLASALVAFLVLVVPVLGRRRYLRFTREVQTHPGARVRQYRTSIIRQWVLVGVVLVIGLMSGKSWRSIGLPTSTLFRFNAGWTSYFLSVFVLAFLIGLVLFRKRTPRGRRAAPLRGAIHLLPRSRLERGTFVGVALTAGICEEILYRGFGLAFLHWAMPTVNLAVDVVVVSLAFGAAHAYQGRSGVAAASIVGALFGVIVASTGTLFVAIVIHALIDLRILALPPSFLDELDQRARLTQEPSHSVESSSTAHIQDLPVPLASPPAGWYPDAPQGEVLRWWDGTGWTDHTQLPPAP